MIHGWTEAAGQVGKNERVSEKGGEDDQKHIDIDFCLILLYFVKH